MLNQWMTNVVNSSILWSFKNGANLRSKYTSSCYLLHCINYRNSVHVVKNMFIFGKYKKKKNEFDCNWLKEWHGIWHKDSCLWLADGHLQELLIIFKQDRLPLTTWRMEMVKYTILISPRKSELSFCQNMWHKDKIIVSPPPNSIC